MQMMLSNEMAKRIDDSNSVAWRNHSLRVFSSIPCVEKDIEKLGFTWERQQRKTLKTKKRAPYEGPLSLSVSSYKGS
jgi:hypothetical protein